VTHELEHDIKYQDIPEPDRSGNELDLTEEFNPIWLLLILAVLHLIAYIFAVRADRKLRLEINPKTFLGYLLANDIHLSPFFTYFWPKSRVMRVTTIWS
jgi:hypothetical protein